MTKRDLVDKIMAYESGEMEEEDIIIFFQELIDPGLVWQLQGSYGRTAKQLIDAGICTAKES
jgi:hypothetical protein